VIKLDASGRRQFKHEATLMAALPSHKNLPKLYGICKTKNNNEEHGYIVLEYLPFPSLKEFIKKTGPLSEMEALNILRQLVNVVAVLTKHNVAHRDIKPDNIMINPDNLNIKIIDFGLAQLIPHSDAKDTSYRGTPIYMAPEVLRQTEEYNIIKAEVWSIGVTFYELLTGIQPFLNCTTQQSLLAAQIFGLDFSNFSPVVKQLLKHMLTPNPDERANITSLQEVLEGMPRDPRIRRRGWSTTRAVTFENIRVFKDIHEKARTGEKEEGLLSRLIKNAKLEAANAD